MKNRRRILAATPRACSAVAALALVISVTVGTATAQAPTPPANDAYLNSLVLNQPGTPLNRKDTLRNVQNTSLATTQTNLFDPPGGKNGGAEVTDCDGTGYGKTIWYDFHPDADGTMLVRTSGFENVITLYTYNEKTLKPDVGTSKCATKADNTFAQLDSSVKKGKSYTIQIGGVDDAGGKLVTLFDYQVKALKKLSADATVTGKGATGGIAVKTITVKTTKKAKVVLTCGGRCKKQTKTHKATEKFNLGGVVMPVGAKLTIRVTAPKMIGVYIQYTIKPSSFAKKTLCLQPGSNRPRKKCQ
jgi:hypothetical protein